MLRSKENAGEERRISALTTKNAGVPLAGTRVELGWNCLELLKINVELIWNGWNACGTKSGTHMEL